MHKIKALTLDISTGSSTATPRINLSTVDDVRREMGRVYRDARLNALASSDATRLVYILSQILKAHELFALEKRILELEELTAGGSN